MMPPYVAFYVTNHLILTMQWNDNWNINKTLNVFNTNAEMADLLQCLFSEMKNEVPLLVYTGVDFVKITQYGKLNIIFYLHWKNNKVPIDKI